MHFDGSLNSRKTVLGNIHAAFLATAKKDLGLCSVLTQSEEAEQCLAHSYCISSHFLYGVLRRIETSKRLISAAFGIVSSKKRHQRFPGYRFTITKAQFSL